MKSVHAALKADQEVSEVLQFRTETVEICFCHGIINGTREECEEAERKVFERTGVHVFSRLRCVFVCVCVCVCVAAAFNPIFQNRFARCSSLHSSQGGVGRGEEDVLRVEHGQC